VKEIYLGAAAFWIALAAVLIASSWFKLRREALKQETLLRMIEKTGQLDEAQVKLLFPPPPPSAWSHLQPPSKPPGDGYHDGRIAMKVVGTILLSIAAGLLILFSLAAIFSSGPVPDEAFLAFGVVGLLAALGTGFFIGARFIYPPRRPGDGETL
jgi:hypothetical protein